MSIVAEFAKLTIKKKKPTIIVEDAITGEATKKKPRAARKLFMGDCAENHARMEQIGTQHAAK